MKSIKATDTTTFQVRTWESSGRTNVTINCVQKNGDLRMVALLWDVSGSNAVSDFCHAYIDAIESMEKMNKIEEQFSLRAARAKNRAEA